MPNTRCPTLAYTIIHHPTHHCFLKELESIEDSWQAETKKLVDSVARLQEENKKLRSQLQDTQGKVDSLQSEYVSKHDINVALNKTSIGSYFYQQQQYIYIYLYFNVYFFFQL